MNPTPQKRMGYFRAAALAHYTSPKRDEVMPEFLRFRWSGLLWALVVLSAAWVGWIWTRPVPVISAGLGLVTLASGPNGPIAVTLVLPIRPELLQADQAISCDSGGVALSGTLVAVEAMTSIDQVRRRLPLGPAFDLPVTGEVAVAHALLYVQKPGDVQAVLARGGCQARLTVGRRPLFTLLRRLLG